jgi:hypothetical protein
MVYEHILGCFIPKDTSSRFSKLFQVVVVVVCGNIFRSIALEMGTKRLLALAKDFGGFHPIVMKCFFYLLVVPLFYNFFRSTYPPISLEYRPLEAVKPSFWHQSPP